ncbi:MAG: hypothetical protein IK143_06935 [Bacteroidales bacterium]|nr:hypothetical protein [Bacteroidales bacterium]
MKATILPIAVSTLLLATASCSVVDPNQDYGYDSSESIAVVTVKRSPADTVYLQLTDDITVYPLEEIKYTGRKRVLCELSIIRERTGSFDYTAHVHWIEPIEEGVVTSENPASVSEGIDILNNWMTGVEDGYLTLRYAAWWGVATNILHKFTIVTGQDPEDPYSLILHHDASGDRKDTFSEALICFDINSLPDTDGQYVPLTLKWTRPDGTLATHTFEFKTRK